MIGSGRRENQSKVMLRQEKESPLKLANVHYYQGGHDQDFVGGLNRKYECPICLLCLRDPHQTSCGHRFCHSCIMTWLGEGRTCPDDNCSLGEGDIFPDAIANREILQLLIRCPNTEAGCQSVFRLSDVDSHLATCRFQGKYTESTSCPDCGSLVNSTTAQTPHSKLICPQVQVACLFSLVGCTQRVPRSQLQEHLRSQVVHHMQLMAEKLTKLQQIQAADASIQECSSLPSSPQLSRDPNIRLSGSNLHNNSKLVRDLYQRIVQLEQRNCQQQIQLDLLEQQLTRSKLAGVSCEETDSSSCGDSSAACGRFVWRIRDFSSFLEKMRSCASFLLYSKGFYSSPFGYKMCLRCNLTVNKGEEQLGMFLHLMKGENDDCITWPFVGSLTITIFNQREGILREHYTESMDTMPGLGAFQRPEEDRSPRGFGFQEFVRVNALYTGGFIKENTLIIKVAVKCSADQI